MADNIADYWDETPDIASFYDTAEEVTPELPPMGENPMTGGWMDIPTDLETRKKYFSNIPPKFLENVEKQSITTIYNLAEKRGDLTPELMSEVIAANKEDRSLDANMGNIVTRLGEDNPFYADKLKAMQFLNFSNMLEKKGFDIRSTDGRWDVDYTKGLNDWAGRVVLSAIDSPTTKLEKVKEITGKEGRLDGAGRVLFFDDRDGVWRPVDSPTVDAYDIVADPADEVPMFLAEVASTKFTGKLISGANSTLRRIGGTVKAAGLDAVAGSSAMLTTELIEKQLLGDEEDYESIASQVGTNFILTSAGATIVPLVVGATRQLKNNPLNAFVGEEERELINFVSTLGDNRAARMQSDPEEWKSFVGSLDRYRNLDATQKQDLLNNPDKLWKEYKLRPAQVNTSAILMRVESILSKVPGGAGVYENISKSNKLLIEEEVAWMLRDVPNRDEYAPILMRKIERAVKEQFHVRTSQLGLRVQATGGEPLGEEIYDAVDRWKADFHRDAEIRFLGTDSLLRPQMGDIPNPFRMIFPTDKFRGLYDKLSNDPSVRKELASSVSPNNRFNKEMAEIRQTLEDLPSGDHISPQEYRKLQDKFHALITEYPTVRKRVQELGESLNPLQDMEAVEARMKSLGYEDAVTERYLREFSENNDWYSANRALYDTESDPMSVFGAILENYDRKGGELSGGAEKIVGMLFPIGAEATRWNNLKYVRKFRDKASPELQEKVREHLIYKLVGDGSTRDPAMLAGKYLNMSDEVTEMYAEVLGTGTLASLTSWANFASEQSAGMAYKLALKQKDYNSITKGLMRPETSGGRVDFDSVDTALDFAEDHAGRQAIRGFFMEEILRKASKIDNSSSFHHLDGSALTKTIDSYGEDRVKDVLGEESYESLLALAGLARSTRSDKSGAGGLAAGFLIANTFLRGDVMGGLITAGKTNIMAQLLTHRPVISWLSKADLTPQSKEFWRNLSVMTVYSNKFVDNEEGLRGKDTSEVEEQYAAWWREAQGEVALRVKAYERGIERSTIPQKDAKTKGALDNYMQKLKRL